ncbi:ABC transporter permease [Kutzneria kofuensis]|uniref:Putative ABC transport system permease protein n=1 Tax=Kutzneria kofuensis TaxID=103725 RepID=A0A7W9NGW5_9PSEU|nr:ABC transporter permease [Kutzneria kofuensis]MBB5891488.1 putative ABC transport system permease protein [Kutzneria kofuensis]
MIRLSGRLRSALIIGMQGIRSRKLRTLLSMVSLFLGVLAVVAVQAGSQIAEQAALGNIELIEGVDGTQQLYLPQNDKTPGIVLDSLQGKQHAVALVGARAFIGEPNVTPINKGGGPIDENFSGGYYCSPNMPCGPDEGQPQGPPGQAIELGLTAMTGDVRQFQPYRLQSGRWLDFTSSPSLAPRIVINTKAAEAFERYRIPAQMRITGAPVDATPQIIGVVDDGGYGPAAYVRYDELANWLPPGPNVQLNLLAAPTETSLLQTLKARLAAAGVPADQLHLRTINSKEHVAEQLALTRWIFFGMAALVLLIGVAGILNVGLATVGERVEEFALRRALGTPRLLLAGIVLAETLLTGLFTSALAIGAGVVGLRIAGTLFGNSSRLSFLHDLVFPWQAGVAGVAAGLIAGLLGGSIPALRAARIPIATVMRA